MMRAFIAVFRAELIKLRHSLLLRISILIPLGYVALRIISAYQRDIYTMATGANVWLDAADLFYRVWIFFVFPLLVTLQTALLGDMEYRNNTWQLVFSQPKKRRLVLLAKQLIALIVPFLSLLCLAAGMALFAILLKVLKPDFSMPAAIPLKEIGWMFLAPFFISSFNIAVQTWISLNWGNFVVSCSTGITVTLIALFLFDHDYSRYFPWDMPGLGFYRVLAGQPVTDLFLLTMILALLVSVLGNLSLSRKEIK